MKIWQFIVFTTLLFSMVYSRNEESAPNEMRILGGGSKASMIGDLLSGDAERTNGVPRVTLLSIKAIKAIEGSDIRIERDIKKKVLMRLGGLRYPVNQFAPNDSTICGNVTIHFVVNQTGRVDSVAFISINSKNESFNRALLQRLQRWRFDSFTAKNSFNIDLMISYKKGANKPHLERAITEDSNRVIFNKIEKVLFEENKDKPLMILGLNERPNQKLRYNKVWRSDLNGDGVEDAVFQCYSTIKGFGYNYLVAIVKDGEIETVDKISFSIIQTKLDVVSVINGEIKTKILVYKSGERGENVIDKSLNPTFVYEKGKLIEKSYIGTEAHQLSSKNIFKNREYRSVKFNNFFEYETVERFTKDAFSIMAKASGGNDVFIEFSIEPTTAETKSDVSKNSRAVLDKMLLDIEKNTEYFYKEKIYEVILQITKVNDKEYKENIETNGLVFTLKDGYSAKVQLYGFYNNFVIHIEKCATDYRKIEGFHWYRLERK